MSARETALQVLTACRRENGWTNGILKEQIAHSRLDARDAALATRLCYGVVQNRGLLDWYLQQLLDKPVRKLRPVLRDILHLGLYQIYLMDKIPPSAAVNESVALAKKYCRKMDNAPALVNGVLRNAVRSGGTLTQPEDLATKYSHPENLVALLGSYAGQDKLEMILRADNEAPDTVIQVNTLRTSAEALTARLEQEGVSVRPHGWMKNCLVLSGTGSIEKLESFRQGDFYVQDAAARLAVECAGLPAGEDIAVADCCAAPGGKTFAAAIAMAGRGSIFSSDLHEHKTELIRKGAQRLGLENVQVCRMDASQPVPERREMMDVVLADVPCSGYGIIRKKPDIRYKDPDTMKDLPQLQLQILLAQSGSVKPGGVLIYSTCTLVRRENEGVVEKFLKLAPDFDTEALKLPAVFGKNESGMLRLLPGVYDTDGFFICRLRRKT